jgi:hypothetical protein
MLINSVGLHLLAAWTIVGRFLSFYKAACCARGCVEAKGEAAAGQFSNCWLYLEGREVYLHVVAARLLKSNGWAMIA